MKTTELVDLTYGDPVVWQLLIDGTAADLSAVTRWILYLKSGQGDVTIDSDVSGDATVFNNSSGDGKVTIDLRKVGSTTLPARNWIANIVSFDPSNPTGVLWGKSIITTIDIRT